MPGEIVLEMKDISKKFPGVLALDHANLEIQKGEVHILLGENGAGKSTLIKILAGAYSRDSGEIFFEGKKLGNLSPKQVQTLGISTIYQEFNLIPHLNIAENIFLGKEPLSHGLLDKKELYKKATEIINRLDLDIDARRKISDLSVAQQQMVEVAKALAFGAKIIIMDEPTATLTDTEINSLFETIKKITSQGGSIIYISHRMEEFERIGDRITIMRDGKTLRTVKVGEMDMNDMIGLMAGRKITEQYPPYEANPQEEVLKVEHLTTDKVTDISFTLHKGEILGFAGLVGSGRTEIARGIIGVDPLKSGTIIVFGEEVKIHSPKDAIKKSIAYLPESRKEEGLILKMGIQDNITIASLSAYEQALVLNKGKEKEDSEYYRNKLEIKIASLKQKVEDLSGGNQQKVVMAKWLLSKCKILIFDEPTRGIDAGAKYEIYKLINSLAAAGTAVIVISSDLPEVLNLSTRICIMHRGRMAGMLNREEATQENILKYATLGGTADE
ncbi:sugar ABC transporter ATP-binding protein [Blautia obeum]|uniref:sugar ABC transporter ATP-binding protein n=1 Tax=Blautia obeum TaxID=40520 RepID=UPI0032BFA8C2